MRSVVLKSLNDLTEWRGAARGLLLDTVPPEEVVWIDPATPQGFSEAADDAAGTIAKRPVGIVPAAFMGLAAEAICNSEPERFALLYRLLWPLQENRGLLAIASDADVLRLRRLATAVRRDSHKMRAFVRFRMVDEAGTGKLVAWFEPDHYVVEATAPFFVNHLPDMNWAIITPYRSAIWEGKVLTIGEGWQGRRSCLQSGLTQGFDNETGKLQGASGACLHVAH